MQHHHHHLPQELKSPAVVRTLIKLLQLSVHEQATTTPDNPPPPAKSPTTANHQPSCTTLLEHLYAAASLAPDVLQCEGLLEASVPQRSTLYGGIGQDGRAMLLHRGGNSGCLCACVGDIVEIGVDVDNRMGTVLRVDTAWTLTLGVVLQARGMVVVFVGCLMYL